MQNCMFYEGDFMLYLGKIKHRVINMKKFLACSLVAVAMLAGVAFGVGQDQALTNQQEEVQLASDLPFEH
ncbi:quorum-sensing peptide PapR [Bacillus cytotoxicus]|nr:quorum-sensing peptide PapR [Bacillus cytotoxicus]MDH2892959.1 quorum-sensing peptide PapR [Bacillus cytotoxicus]